MGSIPYPAANFLGVFMSLSIDYDIIQKEKNPIHLNTRENVGNFFYVKYWGINENGGHVFYEKDTNNILYINRKAQLMMNPNLRALINGDCFEICLGLLEDVGFYFAVYQYIGTGKPIKLV